MSAVIFYSAALTARLFFMRCARAPLRSTATRSSVKMACGRRGRVGFVAIAASRAQSVSRRTALYVANTSTSLVTDKVLPASLQR